MAESSDRGQGWRLCLAVVFAILTIPAGIGLAIDTLIREGMPLPEKIGKVGLAAAFVVMCARVAWSLPKSTSSGDHADRLRDQD